LLFDINNGYANAPLYYVYMYTACRAVCCVSQPPPPHFPRTMNKPWITEIIGIYVLYLTYSDFFLGVTYLVRLGRFINLVTPNVNYSGRTAPLTSKVAFCIYFKHGIYSSFFSLPNAVCFIILTYLVPVLFTFYIQGVLKLKK